MSGRLIPNDTWVDIERWLSNTIAKPDPRLGRTGPLCPFVQRSLRAGSVLHRVERMSVPSVEQISEIVLAHVQTFEHEHWPDTAADLQAIVVSFPDLTPETV